MDTIFVTKLDTAGKYLWAKTTGGLNRNNYGQAIALDCAGDLYLTGELGATATFGATTLTSKWGYSAFVWKLGAGSP
jgi:hypothetical protein